MIKHRHLGALVLAALVAVTACSDDDDDAGADDSVSEATDAAERRHHGDRGIGGQRFGGHDVRRQRQR